MPRTATDPHLLARDPLRQAGVPPLELVDALLERRHLCSASSAYAARRCEPTSATTTRAAIAAAATADAMSRCGRGLGPASTAARGSGSRRRLEMPLRDTAHQPLSSAQRAHAARCEPHDLPVPRRWCRRRETAAARRSRIDAFQRLVGR